MLNIVVVVLVAHCLNFNACKVPMYIQIIVTIYARMYVCMSAFYVYLPICSFSFCDDVSRFAILKNNYSLLNFNFQPTTTTWTITTIINPTV